MKRSTGEAEQMAQLKSRGRLSVVLTVVSSIGLVLTGAGERPAAAAATSVTGSAYGYLLNVSLFGGPVNTRGPSPTVTLPPGGSVAPVTASAPTGSAIVGPAVFFSSGQLNVSTQGTMAGGSVTSTTNIANVNTSGQESFTASNVASSCTTTGNSATRSTTITGGTLEIDNGDDLNDDGDYTDAGEHAPVTVPVPTNPAPNTEFTGHIHVNGIVETFRYVFNEHLTNSDGSFTVNAGHEYMIGPTAVGELTWGHASCGKPVGAGGYWMVAADGGIFSFGGAGFHGSTGDAALAKPIVGMTATPSGQGYFLVASDGGIFSFGDAGFFGSTGAFTLAKPIVGMAATPSGLGYWLVASDGGIFAFGDAGFHGSTGDAALVRPIVGMAATPSGQGYFLVASDGGIFSFGDAGFFGSTGAFTLARPIVGMAVTPSGLGYWLVASDGGIFAFGDAGFFGSTGAVALAKPIVSMEATPSGQGYWLVASDGGIFAFGDAAFFGSTGSLTLAQPIVDMAVKV